MGVVGEGVTDPADGEGLGAVRDAVLDEGVGQHCQSRSVDTLLVF